MAKVEAHYTGHRSRLRERFLKSGFGGFADHEVVELLLTMAITRSDVKPQAKMLLERFGSLRGILDAPVSELKSIKGVGEISAILIKVIRESATLYLMEASKEAEDLRDPQRLSDFWRMRIGHLKNEVFAVAYLDSAHRLIRNGVETLQEGTIDRAAVYPRRVVEAALKHQAAALVLAHNHPNGDVQPSEQDKIITRAVTLAAGTISIRVVDHLIVSTSEAFSFRKAGLL